MCGNVRQRTVSATFSCYGISKQTPNDVKPLQFSNRGSGNQFNDRRMAFRMLRFDLPPDNFCGRSVRAALGNSPFSP